jgi:hypothetical protein
MWARLEEGSGSATGRLGWYSFPWPVLEPLSAPEEMTLDRIKAYVFSPHGGGATKTNKERLKGLIRRWHPDKFETNLLLRVKASERDKVKAGAGVVVRVLNELLSLES